MTPLLELHNVTVRRDERVALDGVTLSIAQGEHAAILGPNGSGKSTLIKVISRDLYPVLKPEPWSFRIQGRGAAFISRPVSSAMPNVPSLSPAATSSLVPP